MKELLSRVGPKLSPENWTMVCNTMNGLFEQVIFLRVFVCHRQNEEQRQCSVFVLAFLIRRENTGRCRATQRRAFLMGDDPCVALFHQQEVLAADLDLELSLSKNCRNNCLHRKASLFCWRKSIAARLVASEICVTYPHSHLHHPGALVYNE